MTPDNVIPNELFHCRLHEKEITDPYDGIRQFFDGENIQEIRAAFERMKETLLTESFGEQESSDKYMIVYFMNRLEILYESCFILHNSDKQERLKA